MWIIGGFLSLVTRLSNLILAGYQSFTIDKSMLKKVFSMRMMGKDLELDEANSNDDSKHRDLIETIKTRQVFRYSWKERFWADLR